MGETLRGTEQLLVMIVLDSEDEPVLCGSTVLFKNSAHFNKTLKGMEDLLRNQKIFHFGMELFALLCPQRSGKVWLFTSLRQK